ncbi:hypothetical protein EYF80_005179 [Liparis tanakae]|uniref:Uncharacterized protein n=1 Tax=Liparis tanakae TaxID=230148 RepID=A0A4Z2J2N6_9TELE|nr:hypothetical protein EYF80_005179 [Liparis tanakae]
MEILQEPPPWQYTVVVISCLVATLTEDADISIGQREKRGVQRMLGISQDGVPPAVRVFTSVDDYIPVTWVNKTTVVQEHLISPHPTHPTLPHPSHPIPTFNPQHPFSKKTTAERWSSTNHGVLWVGLFVVHLRQLLRSGAVDPTQHIEPTTGWGQREFTK